MAKISSVTTPQPKQDPFTRLASTVLKQENPMRRYEDTTGKRTVGIGDKLGVGLLAWDIPLVDVPKAPPAGSRMGALALLYIDIKQLPKNTAKAIKVSGPKQLGGWREGLRKHARKDGTTLAFSRNAESTVLYCWIASKE